MAWCDRKELGEMVSLVSRRLFAASHPFMHEEKVHPLPTLKFDKAKKKLVIWDDEAWKEMKEVPLPSVDIPQNLIRGDTFLWIECVSQTTYK